MIYNALTDCHYSKVRFESFGKWSGPSLTASLYVAKIALFSVHLRRNACIADETLDLRQNLQPAPDR